MESADKLILWVKATDSEPMKIRIEKSSDICDCVDQAIELMSSLHGITNERIIVKCGGSKIDKDQLVKSELFAHHGDSAKNALVLHIMPHKPSAEPAGLQKGIFLTIV